MGADPVALIARRSSCSPFAGGHMRYVIAWLLGVPFSIIVIWYILGHTACA